MRKQWAGVLTLAWLSVLAAGSGNIRGEDHAAFPLREGDTWVMSGDSITAQHLHTNYFEAFCFARYPKMTFRFRNSGVGGDTIQPVTVQPTDPA